MTVTKVLLDILVVLLAAKVAAEVAERAQIPAVVGEILAGIVIGPSALGLVGSDEVLRTLGELGVILLLFDVGLEMDLAELAAVGRAALLVASIGVVVPFATGLGVGHVLGMSGSEALFVGAALTATSVGITARVFGDLRALATVEARTVLGAAVADDVMGLVILTVVVRIATSGHVSLASVGGVLAVAVAFLVGTTAIGIRIAPAAFAFVARVSRSNGTLVALALAFALAFAELADAAQLAPIVGAFVAGVCLGRSPAADRVRRELTPVGHLFIPVFFLQVGIDADLGQFAHAHVLRLAGALLVVAVAGKLVSAVGLWGSPGDRLLVGIGMIPRGEVGLIFATIGLREHVFGEDVYGALLLVVLVTTLVTPPLLRWRLLRRRAAVSGQAFGPEPPGGWLELLRTGGGTVELVGDPPPQLALEIGLTAALLGGEHRPGPHLLDWLAGLPDQPLRWDGPARAKLFEVLDGGGPRTWRFLSVTGLLDRALPELGQALARRQADPVELDPAGVLIWSRLSRLQEMTGPKELARPELLALAALVLDASDTPAPAPSIITARRVAQRLDLGARGEETVADLVRDAGLLISAARRSNAFDEERVLTLAVHLGTPDQAGALFLLTLAGGDADEPAVRQRVDELHRLIQLALKQPELTGREASNALSQRRAEAVRLAGDEAIVDRIVAAPRAYVLSVGPPDLVRQARLCEPAVVGDAVRVGVMPVGSESWVIDVVARDGVGLLAREALALADIRLDVRAATLAIWGDGVALASFCVQGDEPSGPELEERIRSARGARRGTAPLAAKVVFDHEGSPWHTVCRVQAPDRTGLLFDIASAFSVAGVNVHAARISGQGGTVIDEFELTDRRGEKLRAADEAAIVDALGRGVVPVRRLRRWRPNRPPAVDGTGCGVHQAETFE